MRFLRNPFVWLGMCLAASLFLVAYPLYVIWPFRQQEPHQLMAALAILRVRPAIEIVLAVAAAAAALIAWTNRNSIGARIGAAALAVLVFVCAGLSFVNIYEKMFHPLDRPVFAAASASKLDPAEQVIAVRFGTTARAYPIRIISYHHIVNDVLDGVPIAATY